MIRYGLKTRYGRVDVWLELAEGDHQSARPLQMKGPNEGLQLVRKWLSTAVGSNGHRLGAALSASDLHHVMQSFHAKTFFAEPMTDVSAP